MEINYSYTLDYVSWTCPKCNNYNEKTGEDVFDNFCSECGFTIDNEPNQTTNETETLIYEED